MSLMTILIFVVVAGIGAGLSVFMPKPGSLPMAMYKCMTGRRVGSIMIGRKNDKYSIMLAEEDRMPVTESGKTEMKGMLDDAGTQILLTANDGALHLLVCREGFAVECIDETNVPENRSILGMLFKRHI